MKKYQKEIIKEGTVELIKSIFDIATPFFEASRIYRKSAREYKDQRSIEKSQFWQKISYLKRRGLIDIFVKDKERYYEISTNGKKILQKNAFKNLKVNRPNKWDGKWRIIIFDVPEKLRASRDALRDEITQLGFFQIQKSVYVYPFECSEEILFLSEQLLISKYVLIMISEIIQGEEEIIEYFIKNNILLSQDIKNS